MIVEYGYVAYVFLTLFLLGCVIGSFLNVVIARLPRGKSLVRPGSHCFGCGRAIPLRENIPLLSYWLLGGKCRVCKAPFSLRYFAIELLTGVGFAGIFFLEVGLNLHRIRPFGGNGVEHLRFGFFPHSTWLLVGFHFLFFCFLLVAVCSNLEFCRVPRSVWVLGLLVGLVGAAFLAWPAPYKVEEALAEDAVPASFITDKQLPLPGKLRGAMPLSQPWFSAKASPYTGFYLWPVWGPLPARLAPASWRLGLLTGLVGAVVGIVLVSFAPLRTSWGDIPILALAGAYLGWQPAVLAYVIALGMAVVLVLLLGKPESFSMLGLTLPIGILAAWFGWPWVSGYLARLFFQPMAVAFLAGSVFAMGLLRLVSGRPYFYEPIDPIPAIEPGDLPTHSDDATVPDDRDLTKRPSETVLDDETNSRPEWWDEETQT